MLDINLFRQENGSDPERIRESQRRRCGGVARKHEEGEGKLGGVELVDEVIALDKQWRQRMFETDNIRKEENNVNRAIMEKMMARQVAPGLMAQKQKLEEEKIAKEKEADEAWAAVEVRLREVGNLVHVSVPIHNNEDNNEVVRTWGTCREEGGLHNHVDLVNKLGIVELEAGTDVAGGRGYFLKHYGVLLNQAIINFGLAFLVKRGYTLLQTPFFMRKEVMAECAQLAQFDEELYKVSGDGDDKYLIATAEQPLCALHRNQWMDPKTLPIKYAGYSTCFRKEAGSHGRDTVGIFRVHQFEKLEQFCITSPNGNESWDMHEEMLKNSEEFYQELGLPYRVVSVVSGALNDSAAKKYDLEAWFPASKTYRELVSCSNCTDYQSRNLEIRYGQKNSNDVVKQYVHLLNSTLTATERTLCCILENYQTPEGVRVPDVLQPFMLNTDFLPFFAAPQKDCEAKRYLFRGVADDITYMQTRWSHEENLVLLTAKKREWEARSRGGRSTHEMAQARAELISKECAEHGVFRSARQCADKWDSLASDFRKIYDYELHIPSGRASYWNMTPDERKFLGKMRGGPMHVEVYRHMEGWWPQSYRPVLPHDVMDNADIHNDDDVDAGFPPASREDTPREDTPELSSPNTAKRRKVAPLVSDALTAVIESNTERQVVAMGEAQDREDARLERIVAGDDRRHAVMVALEERKHADYVRLEEQRLADARASTQVIGGALAQIAAAMGVIGAALSRPPS